MAGSLAAFGAHTATRLAGQAMNLLGAEDTALAQDFLLLGSQGFGDDGPIPRVFLVLAGQERIDLLRDPHTAPIVTAHGAEIGIDVQVLIVQGASRVRIEREFEVFFPVQCRPSLRQLVVAVAAGRDAQGHIRCMCGDAVGDASLLDVVLFRQTEVLLGGHIAKHASPVIGGGRRADATGDVVVPGEDVGDQRSEHIERRTVAQSPLDLHVVLDLIEGNVARAFNHHLHALAPSPLGEFPQRLQLRQLGAVGGIRQSARTQTVADGEAHVELPHDAAQLLPQLIHGVLPAVVQHPLGEQTSAATDDADQAVPHEGQMFPQHARMDGEVVHALLGLPLHHLQNCLLVEILQAPADDHRINGHGSDRHGAFFQDGFPAGVQVAAGGQIHHGVGSPADRPVQLFQFRIGARRDRRSAHVGVDFGVRGSTDGHRIQPITQMHTVGRNDHPAGGHFVTDLFGSQVSFALGDTPHLRRYHSHSRVLQLSDRPETHGESHHAAGTVALREHHASPLRIEAACCPIVGGRCFAGVRKLLGAPALWEKVPGGERRRCRHARRVRRRERPATGDSRGDPRGLCETARRRSLTRARRVHPHRRQTIRAIHAIRSI